MTTTASGHPSSSQNFASQNERGDRLSSRPAPSKTSAAILGCAALRPTRDEIAFFADAAPWGFILFARNIDNADQVYGLVDALRSSVGWRAPVLIDQEGGRVARLKGPVWREWKDVGVWADAVDRDKVLDDDAFCEALTLRYQRIAAELTALGIDVNCAPLVDVRRDQTHAIIGTRALGRNADAVARRARAVCDGLRAGGVAPVIKHIPGHGLALVDSHEALPIVGASRDELSATDFAAFRPLADQTMAMTAHIVYTAIDPEVCATMSATVIGDVIREEIGFDGLLMSDDISMDALSGTFDARAEQCLRAGCDVVLHCNGDRAEMAALMSGVDVLADVSLKRANAALEVAGHKASSMDLSEADRRLAALLAPLKDSVDV